MRPAPHRTEGPRDKDKLRPPLRQSGAADLEGDSNPHPGEGIDLKEDALTIEPSDHVGQSHFYQMALGLASYLWSMLDQCMIYAIDYNKPCYYL